MPNITKAKEIQVVYWEDVKPKNATLKDLIEWVLTDENSQISFGKTQQRIGHNSCRTQTLEAMSKLKEQHEDSCL